MEIYSFDSMEELLAKQQQLDSAAQQAILPTQRAMKPGSWWVRPHDEIGCFIFGHWPTLDEVVASEREAGATAAEAEYVRAHETDKAERGYMFGTAYSPIEPEGELGTTHVSVCWPISEGEFMSAQGNGFELGVPNPNGGEPLVAQWVVRMCKRIAKELVKDAMAAPDVPAYFNTRIIRTILEHSEWWEPERVKDDDPVFEVVTDADKG